jgi:hypothetical protein
MYRLPYVSTYKHRSRFRTWPNFYIVLESDLKAKSPINLIFKYADDTNLLVPECTDVQIQEEIEAILDWAAANKMTVNMTKTTEIVFRRPNPKIDLHFPPSRTSNRFLKQNFLA